MNTFSPAPQFSGSFMIRTSVYSCRNNHQKGEKDYQAIKHHLAARADRIKALPDSVVIEYESVLNSDANYPTRLNDLVNLKMVTEFGEQFSEKIWLPIVNKSKQTHDKYRYDSYSNPIPVDTAPDYYEKFIESVVTKAEQLAKLFQAKSDDPYKLP